MYYVTVTFITNFMSLSYSQKILCHHNIHSKFCLKCGYSLLEIIQMIKKALGNDSMSEAQIKFSY